MKVIEFEKVSRIYVLTDDAKVLEARDCFSDGVSVHLQKDGSLMIFPRNV